MMFARSAPALQSPLFWSIFTHATSYEDNFNGVGKLDKADVKIIQRKMVTAFNNYFFAMEAWGLIVVPTWLCIPRIGNVSSRSRETYSMMLSPVTIGTKVYTDGSSHILSIEGELKSLALSGIRTARGDVSNRSVRLLTFVVGAPCTIFICIDQRVRDLPKWLSRKGFNLTPYRVQTNTASLLVFAKQFPASAKVTVGGCASSPVNADNLFVLISRSFRPSYRKQMSEVGLARDHVRFHLPRGLGQVLPEESSLAVDLNVLRWHLHKDTPLEDINEGDAASAPDSNRTHAHREDLRLGMACNFSPSLDMYRSLLVKTRYKWNLKYELGRLLVEFQEKGRSGVDLALCIDRMTVGLKWLHYLEDPYGFLPRFDSVSFKMQSEIEVKVACSVNTASRSQYPHQSKRVIENSPLEYLLEPVKSHFELKKVPGVSLLNTKFTSNRVIVFNVAPPMLYTLMRSVTETQDAVRTISLHELSFDDSVDKGPGKPASELGVSELIFHNQLGQDVHMKVVNAVALDIDFLLRHSDHIDDEENDSNTFFCSMGTNHMVHVKIPDPNPVRDDPVSDLVVSVQTAGWGDVDNISLVSSGGMTTYPFYPVESDRRRNMSGSSNSSADHTPCDRRRNGTSTNKKIEKVITNILEGRVTDRHIDQEDKTPFALCVDCKLVPINKLDEFFRSSSAPDTAVTNYGRVFQDLDISDDELDVSENADGEGETRKQPDKVDTSSLRSCSSCGSSAGRNTLQPSQYALVVVLKGNVDFQNESGGDIDIRVVDVDTGDEVVLEVEPQETVPLPISALRQNGFTMQKVWALDMFLGDPVHMTLLRESFDVKVPARLRISRQHQAESMWIYYRDDAIGFDSLECAHDAMDVEQVSEAAEETTSTIFDDRMSTALSNVSLSELEGGGGVLDTEPRQHKVPIVNQYMMPVISMF